MNKLRNQSLDSLRGIGILLIFILHVGIYFPLSNAFLRDFSNMGSMGVQIFFIISGLSLSWMYKESEMINFREFIYKRMVRLLPMFYLFIIINLMFFGLVERHRAPHGNDISTILLNLSLLGWLSPWAIDSIIDGSWFIFSLMVFYLIFPFLKRMINSIYRALFVYSFALFLGFLFSIILIIFYRHVLIHYFNYSLVEKEAILGYFYYLPINHIHEFILGIVMSYLLINNEKADMRYSSLYILFYLFVIFFSKGSVPRFGINLKNSILSLLLIIPMCKAPVKILVNPFFVFLGQRSLSIFLNHLVILDLIKEQLLIFPFLNASNANLQFTLVFFVSLVLSIIIAIITYNLIEVRLANYLKLKYQTMLN